MTVHVSSASSAPDLARARAIREAVFVREQAVPREVEVDGLDDACEHFLAWLADEPVATARARVTGTGFKLERVAVAREHRGLGVGRALIASVLSRAPRGTVVYVHAQESALGFWERAGFVAQGPSFEEGGIVHRLMTLTTERARETGGR